MDRKHVFPTDVGAHETTRVKRSVFQGFCDQACVVAFTSDGTVDAPEGALQLLP